MFFLLLLSILTFILGLGTFIIERYSFSNAPFLQNINSEKPIETSLTIIIPAYNEELNIAKCLKSLSEIKRPSVNFKILVVDDLSTDKTFLEAKNLKEKSVQFIIEPYLRFKDQPGEQATMFFLDPSNNALEFKAFQDLDNLFQKHI